MQIIEHSVIGTRSAVLRLRRRGSAMQFVVFPMVHIGQPEFYQAVAERLRECDLVVVEGLHGTSLLIRALTSTYRVVGGNRSAGLVVDNIPYQSLGVPVIAPDLTAAQFASNWRSIGRSDRFLVWCLIPLAMIVMFFRGNDVLLSAGVEVNDLPTARQEEEESEAFEDFGRVLVGDRDQQLYATLDELVRSRSAEPIKIAIVYGAAHVPGIVRELQARHSYRVRSADWLTVAEA